MQRIRQQRIGRLLTVSSLALAIASCGDEPAGGAPDAGGTAGAALDSEAPGTAPVSAAAQAGPSGQAGAPDPSPEGFEEPPVFQASEILSPAFARGSHFRVDDEVRNDGVMNHFRIHSDFGEFQPDSQAMLGIRLHEIQAITALKEVSSGDVTLPIALSFA